MFTCVFIIAYLFNIVVNAELQCEEPFILWNNHCYYKAKGANMLFSQADFFCRSINASVVQVDSESENNFLRKLGDTFANYWIRVNVLVGSNKNNITAYSNWAFSQPDKCCGQNVNCVQMDALTGFWDDTSCNQHAYVVCETLPTHKAIAEQTKPDKIKMLSGFSKFNEFFDLFSLSKDNLHRRQTFTLHLPLKRRLVVGRLLFLDQH